jgi:hypothetical protein
VKEITAKFSSIGNTKQPVYDNKIELYKHEINSSEFERGDSKFFTVIC